MSPKDPIETNDPADANPLGTGHAAPAPAGLVPATGVKAEGLAPGGGTKPFAGSTPPQGFAPRAVAPADPPKVGAVPIGALVTLTQVMLDPDVQEALRGLEERVVSLIHAHHAVGAAPGSPAHALGALQASLSGVNFGTVLAGLFALQQDATSPEAAALFARLLADLKMIAGREVPAP